MAPREPDQAQADTKLGVGVLLFGLLCGAVAGLADTDGTTQAVTTALVGIVGAGILTGDLVAKRKKDEGVDRALVGIVLGAMSLGALFGIAVGVGVRLAVFPLSDDPDPPVVVRDEAPDAAPAASATSPRPNEGAAAGEGETVRPAAPRLPGLLHSDPEASQACADARELLASGEGVPSRCEDSWAALRLRVEARSAELTLPSSELSCPVRLAALWWVTCSP